MNGWLAFRTGNPVSRRRRPAVWVARCLGSHQGAHIVVGQFDAEGGDGLVDLADGAGADQRWVT